MFKNNMRGVWLGAAVVLAVMGNTITGYADTVIPDIKVRFTNNYDSEGQNILEPTVTASGSGYGVESVSWSKEPSNWKPGSKVTATVTLKADNGRSFSSEYKSNKVFVSGGAFVSAKRENETGILTLKAGYHPVVQLGVTEKAGWSDAAKTRATWKRVPHATAYQLRLYAGGDEYVTTITLEGTAVDLSQYMTKEANYFYEVRATAKDSSDANYMRNGAYVTSVDTFVNNLGETEGHFTDSKEGRRYTDAHGETAKNGWRFILGDWYYFDENGYAVVGWRFTSDTWYYMNGEGKMQTGWLNLDNKWYYTQASGAMVVGWYQTSPTDWYYFYQDGSMAVNVVIDGFIISESGKRQ